MRARRPRRSCRHGRNAHGFRLASFCRQTHGFRAGVEFSAENRLESAPRTALGRERGDDFWSLFELQPLESVRTACYQQNAPLRSRQEAWGNGIIIIVTAGNGQARHKAPDASTPGQSEGQLR